MTERLLVRHHERKATKNLEAWEAGAYDTYTVLAPIPGVRVHERGVHTLAHPSFDSTLGSPVAMVFGSPHPVPLGHRKIRKNVRM